ncbi:hypothetical protein WKK05_02385 [Nostoc sp. UHCC 0302]|uniref:hypothetical protein n=1 Tax=Nostoc sp. UHCC 0302 TaxID=3134896 RepID=UPI00311CDCB1
MKYLEPNNINAIEVNGVCFETVVSEKLLIIPEAKRSVYISIQLGISITNNTQSFYHFSCYFYSLFPELVAPDGQIMRTGIYCERLSLPNESDYVLVIPGERVTFSHDAFLFWSQNPKKKRDRNLALNIPFPSQDVYSFCPLYPGKYKFRIKYKELSESIKVYSESMIPTILQNIWAGEVLTPFIDIQLVSK